MIEPDFFPEGVVVGDFFLNEAGFVPDTLPGSAKVLRIEVKAWEGVNHYELRLYAEDDMTRPWTKSLPVNTVLVLKEQER